MRLDLRTRDDRRRQVTGFGRLTAAAPLRHLSMAKRQRGRKRQPDGGAEQVGRRTVDGGELGAAAAIEPRHGRQQTARVGVQRSAEHPLGRAALDDARRIHHVHAIGVARDDAEIVRDDDDGDAEPPRQILHQLQDLRLDGDVRARWWARRRSAALGLQASADGDHHALAHAAGKLMRILVEPAFRVGDAHQR